MEDRKNGITNSLLRFKNAKIILGNVFAVSTANTMEPRND